MWSFKCDVESCDAQLDSVDGTVPVGWREITSVEMIVGEKELASMRMMGPLLGMTDESFTEQMAVIAAKPTDVVYHICEKHVIPLKAR